MVARVDERRETGSLIGSDKVEGTAVYGPDDRNIGTVQRVMIDKVSGKVAYAVVSFGGFLGMGEDYYPMPWSKLHYDTSLGGYRVDVTEDQLKGAPKFNRSTDWDWSDRSRDRTVHDYSIHHCGTVGPRAVHIVCLIQKRAGSDIRSQRPAQLGRRRGTHRAARWCSAGCERQVVA
jgi:PRC-barrel domain